MTSQAKGYLRIPVWCDDGTIKVLVNDDGRIPITLENSDIPLNVRPYGHDGTNWQELGLIWSYNDRYIEPETFTVTQAGTNTLTFSSVPEDEIWIIQAFTARNLDSSKTMVFVANTDSSLAMLDRVATPGVAVLGYCRPIPIVLKYQDFLTVLFYACAVDDRLEAYVWGYKMKVSW